MAFSSITCLCHRGFLRRQDHQSSIKSGLCILHLNSNKVPSFADNCTGLIAGTTAQAETKLLLTVTNFASLCTVTSAAVLCVVCRAQEFADRCSRYHRNAAATIDNVSSVAFPAIFSAASTKLQFCFLASSILHRCLPRFLLRWLRPMAHSKS